MTDLRVLLGVCSLVAVMGAVVAIPLGATLALVAGEKVDLLDINTATRDQLKALPGLDQTSIEKIIKNRPYQREYGLVQMKILPRATYDNIKYKIVAKQK